MSTDITGLIYMTGRQEVIETVERRDEMNVGQTDMQKRRQLYAPRNT